MEVGISISVGAQSLGKNIFAKKLCMKNYQNAGIFYDILPKNARILHNNGRKLFPGILGEGGTFPYLRLLRPRELPIFRQLLNAVKDA